MAKARAMTEGSLRGLGFATVAVDSVTKSRLRRLGLANGLPLCVMVRELVTLGEKNEDFKAQLREKDAELQQAYSLNHQQEKVLNFLTAAITGTNESLANKVKSLIESETMARRAEGRQTELVLGENI